MAGKILGQGAAGLSQMAALVVVGIGALLLQNPLKAVLFGETASSFNLNITGASVTVLLLLLVYFILGFLLYATLFAAFGALVRRQDEVQNAVQPLTWLFMIGYLVSFAGLTSPDAAWIRIISYIPFWTPTTMLMRVGAGTVQGWEILMTIGLMIIAILAFAWIAARIYRMAILQYGQKPSLGALMKLLRMK